MKKNDQAYDVTPIFMGAVLASQGWGCKMTDMVPRILIVDDDKNVCSALSSLVKGKGLSLR